MTKRAVVVGINDYSHQVPGWPTLNFCVPDADAVYHLLLDSFGFDPAGVTLLKDAAASSAVIRRSVRYMLTTSEPGDVAFFYYSGHGGLHPGGTAETYYQSIVPHTGRYITDWDLSQAADQLAQGQVNFTTMMDSCHSGGMGDLTPQGSAAKTASLTQEAIDAMVAAMKTVVPFGVALPDISTMANNIQETREALGPVACYTEEANRELVSQAKAMTFSASRWDEYASESSTVGHGYLTKALIDTVDACPFVVTNSELHSRLHTRVHELSDDGQSPVLRGQSGRADDEFLGPWNMSL